MNLSRDIFGDAPKFAILIDPDHEQDPRFEELLEFISQGSLDIVLVGGSTSQDENIDRVIHKLRQATKVPILLFPGNSFQISTEADGLLLPSLISGRNPEYLIGKHVEAANIIYRSGLPVFSLGYILIDGGTVSATSYITQTKPIPAHQSRLAAQTALAGQLLGMKCIYLESGSGAHNRTSSHMIKEVKSVLNIPLIVGGGIRTPEDVAEVVSAGADMVVVGTALEQKPSDLTRLYESFSARSAS